MDDPLSLIREAPKPKHMICLDVKVKEYVNDVIFPYIIKHHLKDAIEYCNLRDANRPFLLEIKNQAEKELIITFDDYTEIMIIPMSSFCANTYLEGSSDIDFGVIVKGLTPELLAEINQLLIKQGYIHKGRIHSYDSFEKNIWGIEIEAKVRDADESVDIITLHQYLDNLDDQTQKIITYIKFLTHTDPILYNLTKSLIYTWAFTSMKDL